MNAYLWFSLKRRWLAKSSLLIFSLSLLITSALLTVDKWLSPHDVVTIEWPSHLFAHLEQFDGIVFTQNASHIKVEYIEPNTYIIHPHRTNMPNTSISNIIQYAHKRYVLDKFSADMQSNIVKMLEPVIEYENSSTSIASIMMISFLYFALLGFSSNMSSDILGEKHSQALLMILNSMSRKEYFKMKLLQNSINIVVQFILVASGVCLAVWFRSMFDNGTALLSFVYEQGWIAIRIESFNAIADLIFGSLQASLSFVLGSMSFIIGLFTCMLVLLWLSLKAQKSEDLAMIQTPFYICIVLMYYVSLWIGEFSLLNDTISPWLTLLPIMSMIFHPFQLSMNDVPLWLSLSSIGLAVVMLYWVKSKATAAFFKEIL